MNYEGLIIRIKKCSYKLFFLTSSTCIVIERTLAIVYKFYLNFWLIKSILILLKIKKSISRVTFMLILANRKVSSKNWNFLSLSFTKKKTITISKVSNLLLLIVCILTSVSQIRRLSFLTKLGCIMLILLPELIRPLIGCYLNKTGYWIYGSH